MCRASRHRTNHRKTLPSRHRLPDGGPGAAGGVPAPRLARAMLIAVLLSFLLITILNITRETMRPYMLVIGLVSLGLIFALQLRHSAAGAARASGRVKLLTLGLQAALTYVPLFFFRSEWGAMAGFLAGSVLLLLPTWIGWSLYGCIGLTMLCLPMAEGEPCTTAPTMQNRLCCAASSCTGSPGSPTSWSASRPPGAKLARTAVANERLRFARDLHDLLGYSLSAITLKSELIHRLVLSHPERARDEIGTVLTISRQSLADVRMVASGYRKMSLSQEATSAGSVLSAAEVVVEVAVQVGPLAPQVDTVLATVLARGHHQRAAPQQGAVLHDQGLGTRVIAPCCPWSTTGWTPAVAIRPRTVAPAWATWPCASATSAAR
ncbi:sensor histidine kinase [Streptomyces sp. L7]